MIIILDLQQVTQRDDQVITTSKCNRCKGIYRQMIVESDSSKSLQQVSVLCCSARFSARYTLHEFMGIVRQSNCVMSKVRILI